MAQTVVKYNGTSILAVVFILIIICAFYVYYPSQDADELLVRNKLPVDPDSHPSNTGNMAGDWEAIKSSLIADSSLTVTEKKVVVDDHEVFYRESLPQKDRKPQGTLLFLHGMAFKSQTWLELGTLHFMAQSGYRVVAVDLPGFGNSPQFRTEDKVDFMEKLMSGLDIQSAVIVSPSMSGSFSLPLLIAKPTLFKGYVPVAPVNTENYKPEEYQKVKVPTCIVYGELDTQLGQKSLKNLANIPDHEVHELKKGRHPAYLDAPKEFHNILLKFSNKCSENDTGYYAVIIDNDILVSLLQDSY